VIGTILDQITKFPMVLQTIYFKALIRTAEELRIVRYAGGVISKIHSNMAALYWKMPLAIAHQKSKNL